MANINRIVPVRPATTDSRVAALAAKVVALERVVGASGSGIQFDTYPQAGDYLYVEVTDDDAAPNGYSLELLDSAAVADGGVHLASTNNKILIETTAAGDIEMLSAANVEIDANNDSISVGTSFADYIYIGRIAADVYIEGSYVEVQTDTTFRVRLIGSTTAESFQIRNGAVGNTPLLEVRGDGTFHIKTGATWVADL